MKRSVKRLRLYQNMKTIAYSDACSGIEIKDIEYGFYDYVWCISGVMSSEPKPHHLLIRYAGDRSYFICDGTRVYLDECLRC